MTNVFELPPVSDADKAYVIGVSETVQVFFAIEDSGNHPSAQQVLARVGLRECGDGMCYPVCSHAYDELTDRFGSGPVGGTDVDRPAFAFEDGARDALKILTPEGDNK